MKQALRIAEANLNSIGLPKLSSSGAFQFWGEIRLTPCPSPTSREGQGEGFVICPQTEMRPAAFPS